MDAVRFLSDFEKFVAKLRKNQDAHHIFMEKTLIKAYILAFL
jgi:hypothetical protein